MSRYYRHLIEDGLLLDIYPNAAVAYSLRKLRSGYKKVFNLLRYSEDITTYQKTFLKTTAYTDVGTAPNGTMTADKLIEDNSITTFHYLTQTLGITVVGLDYNFSVYIKAAGRNKVVIQAGTVGQTRINLIEGSIETTTFPITPVVTDAGNGWWRFSVTFNANSTLLNPLYRIFTVNGLNNSSYIGDGVSGVYVWGFQLTQSSSVLPYEKTVVSPETGAAIRVRRSVDNTEQDFGFDSSGDLDTSTLLDFVGYNLWTYSEQMQQSVWSKANLTVSPDALIAPDGNLTGDILFEKATPNLHSFNRFFAATIGNHYSVSFYVKANGRDFLYCTTATNLSNTIGVTPAAIFDLVNGVKTSDNGKFHTPPTITAVGDWYKIEYTVLCNQTNNAGAIQLYLSPNGLTANYLGDTTKGIAIWGIQISQTEEVKTYEKTVATARGNGFVTTYYDQSGNGNNLTNPIAGYQYRIVVNGNLYRNSDNGLLSTLVTSYGFYFFTVDSISTSNPLINFNVYKSTTSNMILFGNSSAGGRPVLNLHTGAAGSRNIITRLTTSSVNDLSLPFETNGSFITSTTRDTSNYQEVSVNNSVLGGSSIGTNAVATISRLGRFNSGANPSGGEIQEMIIWKQNYVSLKSNISDKINEYYGIY